MKNVSRPGHEPSRDYEIIPIGSCSRGLVRGSVPLLAWKEHHA